jgi:signal transduction histidine kinase
MTLLEPGVARAHHPGTVRTAGARLGRPAVAMLRWLVPAVAAALLLATLSLLALARPEPVPFGSPRAADAIAAVAFAGWSLVGGVVVRRQPGNRAGLILLIAGLVAQTWMLASHYAAYGLLIRPGSLPAATHAAAAADLWLAPVSFGLAFTFLFLLFPDGRLPSRRWRPFAWFAAAGLAFWTFTWGTAPGPLGGEFSLVDNPAGIGLVGRIDPGLGWSLFVLSVLGSAAAVVVRLRRSCGVARSQLKWFTYTAAMVALTWLIVTIGSDTGPPFTTAGDLMFPVAVWALPLAVFIAIFRHQLYDIDVVISRTIVVGALAVLVTGGYVAVVAAVGTAIGRAGEISLGVATVATALVAVAFQPVRVRAQRLADRLVYGRRATPYQVLTALARRMGEPYAADDLLPHLAKTLAEGVGASRVDVWLLADRQLHRVAVWPATLGRAAPRPVTSEGELPSLPGMSEVAAVRHQGGLVGGLAVALPPGHSLGTGERALLADLAAQVGAALDNVRLIEELKASRTRIVAAQDEERRRIERDIHDGVQQRLVALSLALRMAASGLGSAPDRATVRALDEAADEARAALTELRRLARGIHPAILSEGGLVAALESLAERSPVPTEVTGVPPRHLPAPVEVTVYYLVAEALANVAKHARATRVRVAVENSGTRVRVEVTDDGVGGARPGGGSGLVGLADRVAALDGRLEVDSVPDQGTRLRAEIPCASS